jgi:cyclopropane fatty-acyl-phospholipid synthase-like methyltransferase
VHEVLRSKDLQKAALEEVLELKGDEIALDFGCGSGRFSYWIAPRVKKVVGLEVTTEMIELAEKHRTSENVEFILYDGFHFPVFPYFFDLILSANSTMTERSWAAYVRSSDRFFAS